MKFNEAWASYASQNRVLKYVTILLSTLLVMLFIVCIKLSLKEAIIIEKSCYTKALSVSKDTRSGEEIKSFLEEALLQRFDFDLVLNKSYFSEEEAYYKKTEEEELTRQKIFQKALIASITTSEQNGEFIVTVDRIISIDNIKTVLPIALKVVVVTTTRSVFNPYGLTIGKISKIEKTDNPQTKEEKKQ